MLTGALSMSVCIALCCIQIQLLLLLMYLCLGQAKLIASFLFQHFQNIMWAEGHYSLWPNLEENTKINPLLQ